jgi:hypothetical protein
VGHEAQNARHNGLDLTLPLQIPNPVYISLHTCASWPTKQQPVRLKLPHLMPTMRYYTWETSVVPLC